MATALGYSLTVDDAADRRVGEEGTWVQASRISKAAARTQFYIALIFADAVALLTAIAIASLIRLKGVDNHQTIVLMSVMVPIYIGLALQGGAYGFQVLERWRTGLRRALVALITAALVVTFVGFALKVSADFSRLIYVLGLTGAAILLTLVRRGAAWVVRVAFPTGLTDEVLLCDGTMMLPMRNERVINATATGLQPRLDCPQMQDRIGRTFRSVDRVIVACAPEARAAWTSALRGLGVNVELLIPEIETLGVLDTRSHGGRLAAVVARGPLALRDQIFKRLFDLLILLWLFPGLLLITALVAIAIKLDDGGPVFFRQKRIGQGNRLFEIFKFRSMRVAQLDADGRVSTARNDDRVTRVGRFLRSTSIDELPQLFNVLKGDMSIVGPRPHAVGSTAEDSLFWEIDERYWFRHAAKPGLTGLAQVRGFRGATHLTRDLTNRVQADLEYLNNWSIWRDIRIVFQTLKVVLHPNAY